MATLIQPAAARQPFAPVNGSRLQSLTSLKNRQSALPTTFNTPSKRKAAVHDASSYSDDENIDPAQFTSPKRSKGQDSEIFKPSNFILTKAPASPTEFSSMISPSKSLNLSRPMLQPRSPAPRISTNLSNLSAPAGRSPTRKRIGILNRRRTASTSTPPSTFGTRIDPPAFNSAAAPPFSLAAALSGSIPASRPCSKAPVPTLHEPAAKEGWYFEIHEDTPEELSQNLMEHGACTLDISSDEEVEGRRREERGKENVPPMDDISQTSSTPSRPEVSGGDAADPSNLKAAARLMRRRREAVEEGAIEVDRTALGEMAVEEFYADGVGPADVILVAEDDEEEEVVEPQFEFTVEVEVDIKGKGKKVDFEQAEQQLLHTVAAPARVLEPIERAEEGWSVWESGSAKGDE